MTVNMILGILLAGILSNNIALLNFLGTGAVLENRRSIPKSLMLGLGTTLVMVVASAIAWPLNHYVLASVPFVQTMAFVVIVLITVEGISLVAKNALQSFDKADSAKFAINGAILGLCVRNASLGFLEALVTAMAVGVGFMLTATLYAILHSKLDEDSVPKAFQGLPIDLLLAGMMALAMLALA